MSYQLNAELVANSPHICIVHLGGEIDETTLDAFKVQIKPILETENVKAFVFEASNLEFINSGTIGYFAGVYSDLQQQDKKMVIANPNDHIREILDLVGFTNLVECFPTIEEAVRAV